MTLPSSSPWTLLALGPSNMYQVLTLGPSDAVWSPGGAFTLPDAATLQVVSANGAPSVMDFFTPLPGRYTFDMTIRAPKRPHDVADLADARIAVEVADDTGRGIAVYVSSTGFAVSRIGDYGSVVLLPDTADLAATLSSAPVTVRVAVDSALGRAYVFLGEGLTNSPELRFILPAELTPPAVGDRLRLTVLGTSMEPATLEVLQFRLAPDIIMANQPPIADAGPDRVAPIGQAVRFDGRASYDIEGASLTYRWIFIDAPFGSSFVADVGDGHTTDDGDHDGVTPYLDVPPTSLPSWLANGDYVAVRGTPYEIAGFNIGTGRVTLTGDVLPDNLTGVAVRFLDQSFLVGATTDTPYGVPDVQGLYRVHLIVNDGEVDSESVEVLANIVGGHAPYGVEPDTSVLWKALGDEWAQIDGREVFEEAWRGTAQLLAGKLLELWQYNYNLSIKDIQSFFQRKWVPYRTLVPETAPDQVSLHLLPGALVSSLEFPSTIVGLTGSTLSIEVAQSGPAGTSVTRSVTFASSTLAGAIAEINAALTGTGAAAYAFGIARLDDTVRYIANGSTVDDGNADGYTNLVTITGPAFPSWMAPGVHVSFGGIRTTVVTVGVGTLTLADPVRDNISPAQPLYAYRPVGLGLRSSTGLRVTGTAAAILGLPSGWSSLTGTGAIATATSYITFGVDLELAGVRAGDYLVLNNGQSFQIDRVISNPTDPLPGMRVLLRDALPLDASSDWKIPSTITGSSVDYGAAGAYPGDLVKFETYDATTGVFSDQRGHLVSLTGTTLLAELHELYSVGLDTSRFTSRFLGLKKRKALEVYTDTVSVPRLQDVIPATRNPTLWMENVDYVLEPFYRSGGSGPIPMLQFRDSVFIDPDLEPPDIFWAEISLFDNGPQIESLFGSLVGFTRDDASKFDRDFNYLSGTAGLLYARQKGPHVFPIRVGAQILLGQPFAEVAGTVLEVDYLFSPTKGRLLVQDDDLTRGEVVRSYYYRKDPLDLTATSGLDLNPDTGVPWAAGDKIPQFSPIGAGVGITDIYNDPEWYIPFVRAGMMSELEKFHTFLVQYNVDLVSLANLSLLASFMHKASPKHVHHILLGVKGVSEEIDILDTLEAVIYFNQLDSTHSSGRAFTYDDYRGDGTTWENHDDGISYYDGIVDCPTDLLEFILRLTWPGGAITYDSVFFHDTSVVDVSGAYTGIPGSSFTPTYDMSLPAGTYEVHATIKSQGVVLP